MSTSYLDVQAQFTYSEIRHTYVVCTTHTIELLWTLFFSIDTLLCYQYCDPASPLWPRQLEPAAELFQLGLAGWQYLSRPPRARLSRQDDACAAACAASLAVGARCVEPPPVPPGCVDSAATCTRAHVCTCTHCHAATAHWHANGSSATGTAIMMARRPRAHRWP